MSQLFVTLGITIGYFVSYFSVSVPSSFSFRAPFLVQGAVCSILALGAPFIPYSPRYVASTNHTIYKPRTSLTLHSWLVSKGRDEEAWEVIAMFDPEGLDRQKEKIVEMVKKEQEHQALLDRQREAAAVLQTGGSSILDPLLKVIRRNKGIAAVAEAFDDRARSRTIFGIVVGFFDKAFSFSLFQ